MQLDERVPGLLQSGSVGPRYQSLPGKIEHPAFTKLAPACRIAQGLRAKRWRLKHLGGPTLRRVVSGLLSGQS